MSETGLTFPASGRLPHIPEGTYVCKRLRINLNYRSFDVVWSSLRLGEACEQGTSLPRETKSSTAWKVVHSAWGGRAWATRLLFDSSEIANGLK